MTGSEAGEALDLSARDCETDGNALVAQPFAEAVPAGSQTCGACSSSNCNGATRGQMCWTGSQWGNCNIYSGGYMCPGGGWECQCQSGPLP